MVESEDRAAAVLVRARAWVCALSAEFVIETMRPLPIEPVAGAPTFVLGMSIVRGEVTPVVALGILLGAIERTPPRRFVLVRVGARRAVLAVDEVLGVEMLASRSLDASPGLLSEVLPRDVARIGVLDRSVLVMLEAGRLLSEDTWQALAGLNAAGV